MPIQKPPFGAQIDRSNPLAMGLVFAALPNGGLPADLSTGRMPVLGSGTPVYGAHVEGLWLGGTHSFNYAAQTGLDKITTNGSIFLIGRNPTTSSYGIQIASVDPISSGNRLFTFGFDNNGYAANNTLVAFINEIAYGPAATTLGTNAHLAFHRVGVTFDAATVKFYAFGRQASSTATSSTPAADANRRTKFFTNNYDDTGHGNGQNVLALVWNRTLSGDEMADLYRNPWQIFQPVGPSILYFLQSGGAAPISGDVTETLDALTSVSAGTVAIAGSVSQTLAALTSVSAGAVAIKGDVTKTLGALTSVSAGKVAIVGTASQTLGTLNVSSTGLAVGTGVLTQTLGALTVTSAGTVAIAGTVAQTLSALTSSSAGTVAIVGVASPTLGALTTSSAGTVSITGTVSQTLDALTVSSAATLSITGTVSQTLDALTVSSAGVVISGIVGTVAQTLGTLTVTSAGAVAIAGTVSQTLGAVTASSAGTISITGTASPTLAALTASSAGKVAISGTVSQTLAALTVSSQARSDITGALAKTLDALTVVSAGTVLSTDILGSLSQTLEALTSQSAGVVAAGGGSNRRARIFDQGWYNNA